MIFKRYFNKDASSADVFAEQFHISPYVMEIILSRGINTSEGLQEFLTPTKFKDPFLLDGMREFCERIELAAKLQDRVVVFGDYDVDGVCATAIMLKALAKKGIKAGYYLPNRYVDGYGLTNATIDKVIEKFNPTIKELPYSFGIISAYIDYKKSNDTWHINTEGNALKLDKEDYKN